MGLWNGLRKLKFKIPPSRALRGESPTFYGEYFLLPRHPLQRRRRPRRHPRPVIPTRHEPAPLVDPEPRKLHAPQRNPRYLPRPMTRRDHRPDSHRVLRGPRSRPHRGRQVPRTDPAPVDALHCHDRLRALHCRRRLDLHRQENLLVRPLLVVVGVASQEPRPEVPARPASQAAGTAPRERPSPRPPPSSPAER